MVALILDPSKEKMQQTVMSHLKLILATTINAMRLMGIDPFPKLQPKFNINVSFGKLSS